MAALASTVRQKRSFAQYNLKKVLFERQESIFQNLPNFAHFESKRPGKQNASLDYPSGCHSKKNSFNPDIVILMLPILENLHCQLLVECLYSRFKFEGEILFRNFLKPFEKIRINLVVPKFTIRATSVL